MAPEMRQSPDTADGELADAYSIAKTLWVLLAGYNRPFPGQHRADDDICRLTAQLTTDGRRNWTSSSSTARQTTRAGAHACGRWPPN
jgi:hypothetical protein